MIYNYKNSLSIFHDFQITYFMSQQFSTALIIEFVETLNREVKENTSFLIVMLHSFNIIIYKHFTSTTARWNMQNLTIKIIIRNTNLRKRGLIVLKP